MIALLMGFEESVDPGGIANSSGEARQLRLSA